MKLFCKIFLIVVLFIIFIFAGCAPKRAILVSAPVIEKEWTLIEEQAWKMWPDKDHVFVIGHNKVFNHPGSKMKAALLYPFDEKRPSLMACWIIPPKKSTDFTKESDIVTVLYLDGKPIIGEKGHQIKLDLIFDENDANKVVGFKVLIKQKNGTVLESTIWDSRFPQNK